MKLYNKIIFTWITQPVLILLHRSTINYLNKSWSCQIFCLHFRYNYYCTNFKFKTIHNILYKCVSFYISQNFRSDILIFGSNLNKIRNSINRLSNIRFGFTPQKKRFIFFLNSIQIRICASSTFIYFGWNYWKKSHFYISWKNISECNKTVSLNYKLYKD